MMLSDTSEMSVLLCCKKKILHDYKINQGILLKFHIGIHKDNFICSDLFLGMKSWE